jgi:hypothetical protein
MAGDGRGARQGELPGEERGIRDEESASRKEDRLCARRAAIFGTRSGDSRWDAVTRPRGERYVPTDAGKLSVKSKSNERRPIVANRSLAAHGCPALATWVVTRSQGEQRQSTLPLKSSSMRPGRHGRSEPFRRLIARRRAVLLLRTRHQGGQAEAARETSCTSFSWKLCRALCRGD